MLYIFFFFQAEDGIRDVAVTGVQTCALPIYDLRSTSLNTETDRMPNSRQARRIRTAISPRLAIKIFLNIEESRGKSLAWREKRANPPALFRYFASFSRSLQWMRTMWFSSSIFLNSALVPKS